MRRTLLLTSTAMLLALSAPAAASAHHRAEASHRRHHHTVVFKSNSTPASGSEAPAEDAGTIASYEEGVLKIALADGTTVAGRVTEYTQIQCGCPGWDGQPGWHHDGWGQQPGYGPPASYRGADQSAADSPAPTCGASSLVAGAKVAEAQLSLSSFGAFWSRIDLVPTSQS